jgi:putative thioredoxin
MAQSPHVVAVSAESFQQLVIEGSYDRPVLVDFWADWCAPCRMLMPVLASLADAYAGRLLVAKVNTEEEQALAAQFGIRSLPTVQLFKDGRPVDQFMGALPEPQVREFLERHLPRESEQLLARAKSLLGAGNLDGASTVLARAREVEPENPRIAIVQAGIEVAAGNSDKAREILRAIPIELADDPEVARLQGRLEFVELQANSPPETTLKARLEADSSDSEARYRLAAHMVLRAEYEGALEQLLELVKRDRVYEDDAGRKGMLKVFAMLGGEGELVTRYRSKMLNTLY